MPLSVPKTREVYTKDSFKKEEIKQTEQKEVILKKTKEKASLIRSLKSKREITYKDDKRYIKPKGSQYKFRSLRGLVKNKKIKMYQWSRVTEKRNRFKVKKIIKNNLKNLDKLLIVRLHSNKNLPAQIISKLTKLGLLKSFDCILIKVDPQLITDLIDLEFYVTYGTPTNELIKELIMKRGRIMDKNNIDKGRMVMDSNTIIEDILGNKYNIICLKDIIHILSSNLKDKKHNIGYNKHTNMELFDAVTDVINPFELNKIKIPMKGLKTPFTMKGYYGFRGTYINSFVEKHI